MANIEIVYRRLGARIRERREFMMVTQERFAVLTGKSRPSIANIEAGRQRVMIHDVRRFAKILGARPSKLMLGLW